MGRFVISNNREYFEKMQYVFDEKLKLRATFVVEKKANYCACYKKKVVDNTNSFSDGDDFVFVNGTIIYDECVQEEALKRILNDFRSVATTKDIESAIDFIRKKSIGMYFVAISLEKEIYCFVDETSLYATYFYDNDGSYLISNTYYNVNECVNQKVKSTVVLENGVCSAVVGNDTVYSNIYRLLENEYLVISGLGQIQRCEIKITSTVYGANNIDIYLRLIKEKAEYFSKMRSKLAKKTLLFTTGGIDSRLELALHRFSGDYVALGYWAGNDVITNGTQEDLEICKQLATLLEIPFHFFDTTYPFDKCINEIDENELSKYGEYACIYSHNPKWLHIPEEDWFIDEKFDSIGFGALDEIIRETPQVDQFWSNNFSTIDLVKKVKMRTGIFGRVLECEGLVENVARKIDGLRENDGAKLTMSETVNLFNRNRFHSNTIVDNYVNLYCYDFPVFGQRAIVDIVEEMPYSWRQNSCISLALTFDWEPIVVNCPYYSHHHVVLYNSKTGLIEETKKYRLEQFARRLLKNTPLYWPIVKLGHKYRSSKKNQNAQSKEIVSLCMEILSESRVLKESKCTIHEISDDTGFDLASLARMVAEVCMIEKSLEKGNTKC